MQHTCLASPILSLQQYYQHVPIKFSTSSPMANNLGYAHLQSLQVTSSFVHALAKQTLARQAIAKQAHAFRGMNVEDKFFTPHEIYFIGNSHHSNKLWILDKPLLRRCWVPIFSKWCQSPWSKTQGDIISSKPIVQAHGTTSHFRLMIQAHKSHRGNFGSYGLEDEEVCLVKVLAIQSW